jgi:hypothetical protein
VGNMKAPCGCGLEEEGRGAGEGGVGSPRVMEFLRRTHLWRLEEEERESLDLAMEERDIYTEARVDES